MKLFIVILVLFLTSVNGVWLHLPASGQKCLSEEIHPNVVVVADYYIYFEGANHTDTTVSVKVTSPYGNTLYQTEHIRAGQFAFTTKEAGDYTACFSIDSPNKDSTASINIDWKVGIAAKDWDSVARKEKLEGVELQLKKVVERVEDIHAGLIYHVEKDFKMADVIDKTHARVSWLSFIAFGICIVSSGLQVMYLKRYFRKKRLI